MLSLQKKKVIMRNLHIRQKFNQKSNAIIIYSSILLSRKLCDI